MEHWVEGERGAFSEVICLCGPRHGCIVRLSGTFVSVEAYAHGGFAEQGLAESTILVAKELAHGVFELGG